MARKKEMFVRDEDTTKTPTIYMALDLGRRCWTVGVLLPGDRDARLFQIAGGDREALLQLIRRQRQTQGDPNVRVVSCYEAGRDGFWLHRWLRDQDVDNRVLDPTLDCRRPDLAASGGARTRHAPLRSNSPRVRSDRLASGAGAGSAATALPDRPLRSEKVGHPDPPAATHPLSNNGGQDRAPCRSSASSWCLRL